MSGAIKKIYLGPMQKDVWNGAISVQLPSLPSTQQYTLYLLKQALLQFPSEYQSKLVQPTITYINGLSDTTFNLFSNANKASALHFDIAQAILQHGCNHEEKKAVCAMQEVVMDLWETFVAGVNFCPNKNWPAPIIQLDPDITIPIAAEMNEIIMFTFPSGLTKGGLASWPVLIHNTEGDYILKAYPGLLKELQEKVVNVLIKNKFDLNITTYWNQRMNQTICIILSILHIGPSAAIALIGYLRGINKDGNFLRNRGFAKTGSPSDSLKGLLAAYAIRLLPIDNNINWFNSILAEVEKDIKFVIFDSSLVPLKTAMKITYLITQTIIKTPLESLSNKCLQDIYCWNSNDELVVKNLRTILHENNQFIHKLPDDYPASHIVAATILEALESKKEQDISILFEKMLTLLNNAHTSNPKWQPAPIVSGAE
jgi:hypothetical protein